MGGPFSFGETGACPHALVSAGDGLSALKKAGQSRKQGVCRHLPEHRLRPRGLPDGRHRRGRRRPAHGRDHGDRVRLLLPHAGLRGQAVRLGETGRRVRLPDLRGLRLASRLPAAANAGPPALPGSHDARCALRRAPRPGRATLHREARG